MGVGDMNGAPMVRSLSIGIDVGGTFTDLFMIDVTTGETYRHKLSSTPSDPHEAPIRGIREILEKAGRDAREVQFVGLGTTVATNALLERRGACTGLLTTRGFRDLLEIGRQTRPHVYDLFVSRPTPLVPRSLRLEVTERMAASGEVVHPICLEDVDRSIDLLRKSGVQSVAVCFLNSYANPDHERRTVERLREIWPEVAVSASDELVPEFREFERLSSTVLNAYLMPVMGRYLRSFEKQAISLGLPAEPVVMSSGGGVLDTRLASERPIDTLLSGPSGGISSAIRLGLVTEQRNLVTFDMGGTSTDVSLIADGKVETSTFRVIDGIPIRSSAVDVHTVGAGGSSVAWLDSGGLLRVGPNSMGAKPGPACYDSGGTEPTVTDANVVLGRLNQHFLLGGALPIENHRSTEAIERAIAIPKGISVSEAASAILAISVTNIAQAIRVVSVERGLDPADFLLVAFGGAGPLHAADVARELGMKVLIPRSPGVLCAMGVLAKDTMTEFSRTRILTEHQDGLEAQVEEIFAELESRALTTMGRTRSNSESLRLERFVEARYVGQNFELTVGVPPRADQPPLMRALRRGFDAAHHRYYGYDQPEKEIELVTFRVRASQPGPQLDLLRVPTGARTGGLAASGTRRAIFAASGSAIDCPIFERSHLVPGDALEGPAIVEQMDTTTVLPPDFGATVDEFGNLLLKRL
jgi:N-methylhydantoinase A